jgi:hypothetical protein
MSFSKLMLTAPLAVVVPTPQLSASSSVSYCDDIVLDPRGSTGFAGRIWSTITWAVSDSGSRNTKAIFITDYLNRNYNDTTTEIIVPNNLLSAGSTYLFTLTVGNFLQRSGVTSVSVSVTADGVLTPQVLNLGPSSMSYRWKSINLYANVSYPSCLKGNVPIDYNWKVYKGYVFEPLLTSASLDPRYFKLSPYTLDAAYTYKFVITASMPTTGTWKISPSSATFSIQIGSSGVVAKIAGSSSIVTSASSMIKLDASGSIDIDYPKSTTRLLYHWSCIEQSPSYGVSCSSYITDSTVPIVVLSKNLLPAGTYLFSVLVENTQGSKSIAEVVITTVTQEIPSVLINSINTIYNPGEKIILTGLLSGNMEAISASWSSSSITNFKNANLTSTSLTNLFPSGISTFQLSVKPFSLTAGLSYSFTLSASYKNEVNYGSSQVVIMINQSPIGGAILIQPASGGLALTTNFQINTYLWTDADMPLSYILSYYVLTPSSLLMIKGNNTISWSNTVLGQGLQINEYVVTIVATAIDIYNGQGNTSNGVKVNPVILTDDLVSKTQSALYSALQNKDSGKVFQLISASVNSFNSVDCSTSTSCETINRQECQLTAHTCGSCLYGYIGVGGDSNVPCELPGNLVKIGESCVADQSCFSGICDGGICVDVSKSCPNDCSGKGSCVYINSNFESVKNCSVSNRLCSVKCDCFSGFYGEDCSLTLSQMSLLMSARELMCKSLYDNLQIQDVSQDVVTARAVLISNLFQDMSQISDSAFDNCSFVLINTVNEYPVCQGSSATIISNALSAVLQREINQHSVSMVEIVSRSISILADTCQNNLAVGEEPTSVVSNNMGFAMSVNNRFNLGLMSTINSMKYRANANLNVLNGLNSFGMKLFAAQSDLEKFSGATAAALSIDASELSPSDSLGVTLIQYSHNVKGSRLNSTSLNTQLTRYSQPNEESSRRLKSAVAVVGLKVFLENKESVKYIDIMAEVVQVKCVTPRTKPYSVEVDCKLSGLKYRVTCPSSDRGTYNLTCPRISSKPQCQSYNGSAYVEDHNCYVTDFTISSTTCHCISSSLNESTSRRYLTTSHATTEYTSTAVLEVIPFHAAFDILPQIPLLSHKKVILISTITFICLFFLILINCIIWRNSGVMKNKINASPMIVHQRRSIKAFYKSLLPDVFKMSDKSWTSLIKQNLLLHHSWLKILNELWNPQSSLYLKKIDNVIQHWISTMAKFVTLLFFNSLVAFIFYPYNESCSDVLSQVICSHQRSFLSIYQSCEWSENTESCGFKAPVITISHVLLFSGIVVFISTLYNNVLDSIFEHSCIAFSQLWNTIRSKWMNELLEANDKMSESKYAVSTNVRKDEFKQYEDHKFLFLRAARLEKTSKSFLHSTVAAETEILLSENRSKLNDKRDDKVNGNKVLQKYLAQFDTIERSFYVENILSSANGDLMRVTKNAIHEQRLLAERLDIYLRTLNNSGEKEIMLMKCFLIDLIPKSYQPITCTYLFTQQERQQLYDASFPDKHQWWMNRGMPIVSLIALIAHFVLLSYFTILFDQKLISTNSA